MLEEGVFDVAARPLRLGEQLFGHLLLGLKLGPEVLARVKLLSRVDAALVVDRRLVLGTAGMTGSALLAFKLDAEPLSVLLDGEPTAAALVPLNPEDPRMQALLFVDEGRSSGPLLRLGRVCWIPSIICVLFGLVLLWRERLPR